MTLISASIPAPPDGSEPAIVRTRGIELGFESGILRLSMVNLFVNSEFVGGGPGVGVCFCNPIIRFPTQHLAEKLVR